MNEVQELAVLCLHITVAGWLIQSQIKKSMTQINESMTQINESMTQINESLEESQEREINK